MKQLAQHRAFASASEFWQARNPRERMMLASLAALLILAVFYLFLVEPALAGREQLSRSVPQLRQQVAEMQTLAKQASSLPPPSQRTRAPLARESLATTLANHGLNAQNLNVSGEIVRLQVSDAAFSNLTNWLGSVRSNLMLEVAEANIVALPQPDRVNATLTLRQQASE